MWRGRLFQRRGPANINHPDVINDRKSKTAGKHRKTERCEWYVVVQYCHCHSPSTLHSLPCHEAPQSFHQYLQWWYQTCCYDGWCHSENLHAAAAYSTNITTSTGTNIITSTSTNIITSTGTNIINFKNWTSV